MKKIMICLFALIILSSCFKSKKEIKIEPTPTPTSTVEENKQERIPLVYDDISFKTSWTILTSDGQANQNADYLNQNIDILYPGANIEAISLYREGIPFIKDGVYKFSFNASSSIERKIKIVLSSEDGNILLQQQIDINNENKYFEYEFPMPFNNTFNGKISFNLGNDNSENMSSQHTININNILLKSDNINDKIVRINQIGYKPNSSKRFVVPYNVGDYYNVIDVRNNNIVFQGKIGGEIKNEGSKEVNYYGNFKDLQNKGIYRIETSIVASSYDFIIEDNIFDNLLNDSLKMMTIERSGFELDDTFKEFARPASHTSLATVLSNNEKIDVSGGWYDAGDYGRYVKTGSKAIFDLLLSYNINKNKFSNDLNLKLLDEAKFEIDWLFKMQDNSGGVYNKVVSSNFAEYLAPENDNSDLYVLDISTNTTALFSAVMSYAYHTFKDTDIKFAKECLQASKKSYEYLINHPEISDPLNPSEFVAGEYRDDNDKDERLLAALSLYNATLDNKYIEDAKNLINIDKNIINGFSWKETGGYASYIYLSNPVSKNNPELYNIIYDNFVNKANTLVDYSKHDGYFLTILNNYNWGSNMDILSNATHLILADKISGNDNYIDIAYNQLNYVLGLNSLNMSFVTGYGFNYPKNIHNRLTISKNLQLNGALVGGPNSSFEDDIVRNNISQDTAVAKVYIDHNMSYSTNEIAIYWNSSLIFVLTSLY